MPNKYSKTLFYSFALFLASLFVFRSVSEKRNLITIDGDGKGYYAYLPAIFINHSLDWEKLNETKPGYTNDFSNEYEGKKINKYSPGTAIFIFPFFLLAFVLSSITGHPVDGFSPIFQYSVLLSGIFYLFCGLLFLYKFLQTYSLREKNIALTIIIFLLGTNLFYYTIYESSMSHVYAFCCINAFVYSMRNYFINRKLSPFYISVLLYALAILIRPTHLLLILIVPFLVDNKSVAVNFLKLKNVTIGLLLFIIVIALQPVLWFLQTGHLIIMPYADEGFYFSHPQVINLLFSFRKGLFIYTPVLFLSLFGFVYLYKTNKPQSLALGSWLLLLIYLLSAWWNWYYGDSFGQRVFIDYYFLFAFLLAFLLEKSTATVKKITLLLSTIFICLNLIQTYQYRVGIIHPDAMNKEKYIATFLKTNYIYRNALQGAPELFYIPNGKKILKIYSHNFEEYSNKWEEKQTQLYSKAKSGNAVGVLNEETEYSSTFNIEAQELKSTKKRKYISSTVSYKNRSGDINTNAYFIISISDSAGSTYFWKNEKLFSLEKNRIDVWQDTEFGFRLPPFKSSKDKLVAYIWNPDKKKFFIDDIKIEFWEAN
jgi:hypothetical protein